MGITITQIDEVIQDRSAMWKDFDPQKRELIHQLCVDVLAYAKEKGIDFDRSAGITFVTHLTTLYDRLFLSQEQVVIDEELFDQIEPYLFEMAKEVAEIIKKYYKKEISKSEIFLIATHLGAMQERINHNETD